MGGGVVVGVSQKHGENYTQKVLNPPVLWFQTPSLSLQAAVLGHREINVILLKILV